MRCKKSLKRFAAGLLSAAVFAGTAAAALPFPTAAAETVSASGTEGQVEAASETAQMDAEKLADSDFNVAAKNLDTTPVDHFYTTYECQDKDKATRSTICIRANGTKELSKCVIFTDITPTYKYTLDKKGNVKASTGKVIAGITSSDIKPQLTNGKIVDNTVAKVAAASIKSGQITVTAKSLPGTVYLWVMDTGDGDDGNGGKSACIPVTVEAAPSAINLYATPIIDYGVTIQCKSAKISAGEARSVYLYPYYKSGNRLEEFRNLDYRVVVDSKIKDYFTVEKGNSLGNSDTYVITAEKKNVAKSISGKITFICEQNEKKAVFTATIVNEVRGIKIDSASGDLTKTSDNSVNINASSEGKTSGTMVLSTACSADGPTTDKPKVYAMGKADGFDTDLMEQGTVKITQKKDSEQGKISMKIAGDKKTATITAQKNANKTAYFLVVYNTNSFSNGEAGYAVISVNPMSAAPAVTK